MAFVENQGAKIYWDEQGQGEAVLLIMGLAYPSQMWYRTRPLLASRYRTLALDNRGIGQSDVPPGPYPIALMASDAAAVLDAAGIESAHVFGVSMGGMVAQEFALQYPKRVQSLILGCTAVGGPAAVRAEPEAIQMLMRREKMSPEQAAEAAVPFIYDPTTARARIDEDLAIRRPWFPSPAGYAAQLQGILGWESYSRINQIVAPTLVIHGEADRLVPPGNAKLIAERIPGAKLVMIPHASHLFLTDQTEVSHHAILQFLNEQAGNAGSDAGSEKEKVSC
ncbi:MAG TPA: alpha/beta fold hydrolase [Candidatus Sulfotelmatobacter sp.]|jgi:pimeloyl-ACP methyl ester carboxylesterase|nr:alpha/beta fold hydrolase [Candidatus Sulfotelmatobacter sp.]